MSIPNTPLVRSAFGSEPRKALIVGRQAKWNSISVATIVDHDEIDCEMCKCWMLKTFMLISKANVYCESAWALPRTERTAIHNQLSLQNINI